MRVNLIRIMIIYLKQTDFFEKTPVFSLPFLNVHHIPDA